MVYHQAFNSFVGNKYNANFFNDTSWDFHFHKNLELIYVLNGTISCTINNKNDILTAGDFGLCLSNEIHSYIPSKNASYWVCVFSEDYVHAFAKQTRGKEGNTFKFKCQNTVTNYITENLIYNPNPSLLALKSCLYAICDEYLKCVKLSATNAPITQARSIIIDYVSSNYQKNITLSDIAKLLGYDYNYVSRFFHSIFNMSFKDFLNTYRLEAVIQALDDSSTSKKLVDIAFECGFQSIGNFNACFKKKLGISPSEYQKTLLTKT